MSEKHLTAREAAEFIGCTVDHVRYLIRSGKVETHDRKNRDVVEKYVLLREAKRIKKAYLLLPRRTK